MIVRQAAPVRQQVVQALRQDILDQRLLPGQRLVEPALCERYGVSRTVVREALRQLESESLITMRPNRGPIVTVLSRHDIACIYEVRADLEGLMGELFARRATDEQAGRLREYLAVLKRELMAGGLAERGALKEEFYRLMLDGTDNPVLRSSLAGIHARVGIFRHYAFQDDDRVRLALSELEQIVEAAAVCRDPERARAACEAHIKKAGALAVDEYCSRVSQRS